jgi:hypothetical protein
VNQQTLSVTDYFNQPAMRLPNSGQSSTDCQYNSLGYRTHEFKNISQPYVLAFGSSHTDGTGLVNEDRWTSYLEKLLGCQVYAVAIGGSSSKIILQNLLNWLSSDLPDPQAVVFQWPPIYRVFFWKDSNGTMLTAAQNNIQFENLLKSGDENFWVDYIQHILLADALCKEKNVPCVHMILDNDENCIEQIKKITDVFGVTLHLDEKIPGKTWLFDCDASDKIHHSKKCQQQWAERVYDLLVNKTKVC